MLQNLNGYQIILASKSPRRQELLSSLGLKFEVRSMETEEIFPEFLPIQEIPEYLARLKAEPFINTLQENELLITADTIVTIDNQVLGKPTDYNDAFEMMKKLSGKGHNVATGVYLYSNLKNVTFTSNTEVFFKTLTIEEIDFYIRNYKPYDKAGAYGIQEWIGYIAVEKIIGSYFNVMGLPIQRLYAELSKF